MKRLSFAAAICLAELVALFGVPAANAAEVKSDPIVVPQPAAGRGEVVFFRTSTLMGLANNCAVSEGGAIVHSLDRGDYYIVATEPGVHSYSVGNSTKDALRIEVESDEVQYVQCFMKMKMAGWKATLLPVTKEFFLANFKK